MVCLVGGSPWSQGRGVVCLVWGGVLLGPCWGGGGGLPGRGVSLVPGGVLLGPCWGGLPGPGGLLGPGEGFSLVPGGFSGDPPLVNRITDTCKNITLATTSLRPVIIGIIGFQRNFELTVFELTVPDL